MSDVAAFFDNVSGKVNKDKIQGMDCVYQFDITGDDGGQWNIAIANGEAAVSSGTAESPSITITMEASNFVNLLQGKLNGQMAFMTGKLKIKGDMALALKLQSVFSLG
ncbi:MAG: SCP2 sterol-binding domain-containing protein [Candidatus Hydrogenedentes bacterium]|nr:SCP2 sterol-binding domain-containing protein [Candidatus Hydrogenedentota bacterium]